jgi:hypothetical protein
MNGLSLQALISDLQRERFYGSLEVKFEGGKVVLLRKTETLKPTPEDCRDTRGSNDVNPTH